VSIFYKVVAVRKDRHAARPQGPLRCPGMMAGCQAPTARCAAPLQPRCRDPLSRRSHRAKVDAALLQRNGTIKSISFASSDKLPAAE